MSRALEHGRRTVRQYLDSDRDRAIRAAYAAARLEQHYYDGAALRIGRSSTVHAVRWRTDSAGMPRAAPACHTGHSRPDGDPALHPVRDREITCSLCRSRPVALEEGQPYTPASGQYALYTPTDGVPELASYPPGYGDATPAETTEARYGCALPRP